MLLFSLFSDFDFIYVRVIQFQQGLSKIFCCYASPPNASHPAQLALYTLYLAGADNTGTLSIKFDGFASQPLPTRLGTNVVDISDCERADDNLLDPWQTVTICAFKNGCLFVENYSLIFLFICLFVFLFI